MLSLVVLQHALQSVYKCWVFFQDFAEFGEAEGHSMVDDKDIPVGFEGLSGSDFELFSILVV